MLFLALFLPVCGVSAEGGLTDAAERRITQTSRRVTAPTTEGTITREQAQNIALEDAGLTADQVTRLRTEYEIDDGIPRYEVRFRQGPWEYDYEIHAETGRILSRDKDLDD